jgi:hypothetical protein
MLVCPRAEDEYACAELGRRVVGRGFGVVEGPRQLIVAAVEDGEHEGVPVGEVKVDRGCGAADRASYGAHRQGLVVAELVEQPRGGLDNVLAQPFALSSPVAAACLVPARRNGIHVRHCIPSPVALQA